VLRAMLVARDINRRQYRWAVHAPIRLKPGSLYSQIAHPDFFGYVQKELVRLYGARRVEAGGLQVETTIDRGCRRSPGRRSRRTSRSRPIPARHSSRSTRGAAPSVQWSAICRAGGSCSSTWRRRAGGRREARSSRSSSRPRSTRASRSTPTSTALRPTPCPNVKCGTNGVLWDVHNFADESAGTMNLVDATAHSVNTIFAQLVDKVGPSHVVRTAHMMGIRSRLQPVCSITLGTQAVNPLEMTDAYATLASRGIHHPPQALALVRGPEGQILGGLHADGARAIPQSSADLVTYALQHVIMNGTGTAGALERPAAGKTGTAESFQDAWFCGFVPQLTTCVWIGYPGREIPLENIEGVPQVFGGSIPAEIWHEFMSAALSRLPVQDFPLSGSLSTYDLGQPSQVAHG
jgi:penicillin-binding protein 1A